MNEQITVYKLNYDDDGALPPMYVEADISELTRGLEAMLDGADPGIVVMIEVAEVDKEWFDNLEPWEA